MKRSTSTVAALLTAGIALALGSASAAELKVLSDGIAITPKTQAAAFDLRIARPDGEVIQHTALDHEGLLISRKLLGKGFPDGVYTYEVVPVMGVVVRDGDAAEQTKAGPTGIIESGSFAVVDGRFHFDAALVEGRASTTEKDDSDGDTRDQVIADDLIVQGSGCFGFDCVNNENFGFDTIKLKENNLRIKFEDTSTGTFPSNDWQLTANDSASGGANKFSIEDITGAKVPLTVTAGAASNSLFIDSTGRVGFRTSTPVLDLHVATSNTPGIRLEQNNSGGFTAQTWDIAGNEANFFVRDVTSGSLLPFRIRPGAPTSSIDVSAAGNVGIGTANPQQKLEVSSNGPVAIDLNNTNGGQNGKRWRIRSGSGGNLVFVAPDDATAAAEFTLDVAGNLTVSGNFFAQGGTQMTVPDYVFKPGYELMPLDELQTFIEANHHLPNVQSEDEVAAAGKLNMTEMQLRLLEKVEELTLYTLQQHRQIRDLEARIESLSSEQLGE